MKATTREVNLELGRPTADEALRRLEAELEAARHMNTPLLKLIHGYGSSGKGGRIVLTGSVQTFVGSKLKEPYNFVKHGVAGLAKSIAREGADYGIYTYTICPSFIKTPLVEKQIPEQARDLGITEEEVVKNIMLRDTVDGQFTTVEDVANTLVFLSKDQGALTGQSLRLTHGWAMM